MRVTRLSRRRGVFLVAPLLLRQALADAGDNRTRAANALALSLSTPRDKLEKFGPDAGQETSRV